MGELGKMALIGGTVLGIVGQREEARAERDAAYSEARQLDDNAAVSRAASHHEAEREREIAEYTSSRALALAAASGAGVTNPTIIKVMADIEAEGEYRALARLFTGEDEARGMERAARTARRTGRRIGYASNIRTLSTALSAVSDWQSRYGGSKTSSTAAGRSTSSSSSGSGSGRTMGV